MVGQTEVIEEDLEPEISFQEGLDRPVQTTARVGQSFFRTTVLSAYDQRCCITGLSIPRLLGGKPHSSLEPRPHESG